MIDLDIKSTIKNRLWKVNYIIPFAKKYRFDDNGSFTPENLDFMIKTIKQLGIKNIEIFKIHNLSEKKYKSLRLPLPDRKYISADAVAAVANALTSSNIPFKIIKI